uniref:Large ribosomal subunit protein bL32c n=1 Tax=Vicia sepium TaxID=347188 RepID=A0A385CA96_9FABA|nr:ribosomal protein L32 [Vicia sepium]AXQ37231.1 ribosomal protein L32 [Vicia sepium]
MPVPKKRTSISKKKIRKNFWKKKGYKAALKAFSLAKSIFTGDSKSFSIGNSKIISLLQSTFTDNSKSFYTGNSKIFFLVQSSFTGNSKGFGNKK